MSESTLPAPDNRLIAALVLLGVTDNLVRSVATDALMPAGDDDTFAAIFAALTGDLPASVRYLAEAGQNISNAGGVLLGVASLGDALPDSDADLTDEQRDSVDAYVTIIHDRLVELSPAIADLFGVSLAAE